jgi:hypothetical protein
MPTDHSPSGGIIIIRLPKAQSTSVSMVFRISICLSKLEMCVMKCPVVHQYLMNDVCVVLNQNGKIKHVYGMIPNHVPGLLI